MDGFRFDTLTKAFTTSRRITARAFLSVALGALLTNRAADEASAGCKKVGKKCDKSKDCCDGAKCKGGKNGKCRCKSGLTECAGEKDCVDLNDNLNHCGACGNACAAGDVCCNGQCADLDENRGNCGACGVACGSVQTCSAGQCVICQPLTPLCGNTCCAEDSCCLGVCVDLLTSRANCGSCFTLCDFDEICINGVCKPPPAN